VLRLDGDTLPQPVCVDTVTDRDDASRQFVAEDHRFLDDEVGYPAVPVVVHVGAAHADGGDLDEDFVRAG
jgi:hypothetical protein